MPFGGHFRAVFSPFSVPFFHIFSFFSGCIFDIIFGTFLAPSKLQKLVFPIENKGFCDVTKGTKTEPKATKTEPKATEMEAKGCPQWCKWNSKGTKAAKNDRNGGQRVLTTVQMEPKRRQRCQKRPKWMPRGAQKGPNGAQKAPGGAPEEVPKIRSQKRR